MMFCYSTLLPYIHLTNIVTTQPKPTLPTITNPKKPVQFDSVDLTFGSKPSNINLEISKPANNPSEIVVIDDKEDVEDDKGASSEAPDSNTSSESSNSDPFSYGQSNGFDNFNYEEWITAKSPRLRTNAHLLYLSMVLFVLLDFR
jgi:hypothetical protein